MTKMPLGIPVISIFWNWITYHACLQGVAMTQHKQWVTRFKNRGTLPR